MNGQYFAEKQSIETNTADAQSTVGTKMNTLLRKAQQYPNCPHSNGQYFAEKQSIETNTAAAQSTAGPELSTLWWTILC